MGPSSGAVFMQDSHLPFWLRMLAYLQRGNKSIDIRCLYVKRRCVSGVVYADMQTRSWLESNASIPSVECPRSVCSWLDVLGTRPGGDSFLEYPLVSNTMRDWFARYAKETRTYLGLLRFQITDASFHWELRKCWKTAFPLGLITSDTNTWVRLD